MSGLGADAEAGGGRSGSSGIGTDPQDIDPQDTDPQDTDSQDTDLGETELRETGVGRYVSDSPSSRFPVYTRGNAGEVFPEVAYPLSYSISAKAGDEAMKRAMLRTGVITEADLFEDASVVSGMFAGYAYLNMSIGRVASVRMPGADPEETEKQYLGGDEPPPHRGHADDRNAAASLRAVGYVWQTLRLSELPELAANDERVRRWAATLPEVETASSAELEAALRASKGTLIDLFEAHLVVSGRAAVPFAILDKLCTETLDDPELSMRMLGGVGEVSSAAPSTALWELGRMVAGNESLGAVFDAGGADLLQRIENNEALAGFTEAFAGFQAEFASRGPNEWETACPTWGTNPELPLAIIDRLRGAPAANAPSRRTVALVADRQDALAHARGRLRGPNRWLLNRAVESGTLLARSREHSKTTVIRAIHEIRVRQRELARRTADAAGSSNSDDLWFVLEHELSGYLADPRRFADRIANRRSVRAQLAERVPPFYFDGTLPSADSWPLRSDTTTEVAVAGEVLTGIAGCPGIARGRAKVVLDPADPGDLGPGDVLVAPLTDPSWTPLFLSAEAVVVDVGAQLSHAIIVSRELGIPCAVSVTDATKRIENGTLIEVDGTKGTVTIC